MNVLRKLEKDMEDAVADMIDETGETEHVEIGLTRTSSDPTNGSKRHKKHKMFSCSTRASPEPEPNPESEPHSEMPSRSASPSQTALDIPNGPLKPILLPVQREIIASLNTLPNLKKYVAYFPGLMNAHAVIVCRDVKRFEIHRKGEGVLNHWADHFVL